jgi:hypothetical protein
LIKNRLTGLQEILENRTAKSAQALWNILGPIRMQLVSPDIGRPFYRAVTSLDALASTEAPSESAEGGSNPLQTCRRTQRMRTAAAILVSAPGCASSARASALKAPPEGAAGSWWYRRLDGCAARS